MKNSFSIRITIASNSATILFTEIGDVNSSFTTHTQVISDLAYDAEGSNSASEYTSGLLDYVIDPFMREHGINVDSDKLASELDKITSWVSNKVSFKRFTTDESEDQSFTLAEMQEANEDVWEELGPILEILEVNASIPYDFTIITRIA